MNAQRTARGDDPGAAGIENPKHPGRRTVHYPRRRREIPTISNTITVATDSRLGCVRRTIPESYLLSTHSVHVAEVHSPNHCTADFVPQPKNSPHLQGL